MRKFVCILILTICWLVSNGQLYPPIQPYQENDYSLSQVKRFAMASTELSSNWRTELLSIVNNGLAEAGENMVLDESSIYWILDHVNYERRNLVSFTNSRKIGNKIDFFPDHSNFDGMVGIFKYGKCSLVLFKTRCMNLLKVSVQIVQVEPKPQNNPEPTPPPRKTPSLNFNFPEDLGGPLPTAEEKQLKLYFPPAPKERGKIKIWIFTIPLVAIIGGGIYFFTHNKKASNGGGPGGAPITHDSGGDAGGAQTTTDTGGPGGAKTTK